MQKKKLVAEEGVQQAKDEATIQVSIMVLLDDDTQLLSMCLMNFSDLKTFKMLYNLFNLVCGTCE